LRYINVFKKAGLVLLGGFIKPVVNTLRLHSLCIIVIQS